MTGQKVNVHTPKLLTLAQQISVFRKSKKWSQQRLSIESSLNLETVAGVERGRGTVGSLASILKALNAKFEFQHSYEEIGASLKRRRMSAKLSQTALAAMTCLTKPTIIKIERSLGQIASLVLAITALGMNCELVAVHHSNEPMWRMHTGDAHEHMKALQDNFYDCCITDPPYSIAEHSPKNYRAKLEKWLGDEAQEEASGVRSYMRREWSEVHWDDLGPGPAEWRELYRVLKPGAHACIFAAPRLADVTATALRLSGFEIRDTVVWVIKQSTRTSMDIGRTLARAHALRTNPEILTEAGKRRYPRPGGGASAKAGRLLSDRRLAENSPERAELLERYQGIAASLQSAHETVLIARKPPSTSTANCVHKSGLGGVDRRAAKRLGKSASNVIGELGLEHEPFFVTPRARENERNRYMSDGQTNDHPTVKPIELIDYLLGLYAPAGGRILDCFAGSGTVGIASVLSEREFIGIERDPHFAAIARTRIGNAELEALAKTTILREVDPR